MSETVEHLRARAQALRLQSEQTAARVDRLNQTAWALRHADAELAAEISRDSLRLALDNDYARGRAFALRCLGVCHVRADQYKQAAETLLESHTEFVNLVLPDPVGLASTINALAITQKYLGDHQAALANCFAAIDLCEETDQPEQAAITYNNIAGIYSYSGDHLTALDYSYQAVQNHVRFDKSVLEAWSYGNLSSVLWQLGEAEISIRYAQHAIALLREHQDRRNEAMALVNLGAIWQSVENYENALPNYLEGLKIAEQTKSFEVKAEAYKSLGFLALETGETGVALEYLEQALKFSQNINSFYNESETRLYLGLVYAQLGDEQKSVQMFEQALEISERGHFIEIRAKAHLALSKLYEKQKKLAAALFHYQHFHEFWQKVFGGITIRRLEQLLSRRKQTGETFEPLRAKEKRIRQFLAQSSPDDNRLQKGARAALSPRKLRQVFDFINQHLDQHVSLTTLAGIAGLNYDHFIRSFKQSTGKTPHQHLLSKRVERAKSLLETTTLPLAEIALQCGFNSQPHFTTQFRLATGSTPHQFRQSV